MYETIFRRLQHVGSHVACFIMQRALGVPKLTYLLRACPAYKAEDPLARLDEGFVAAFESILKISLSADALTQLSRPIPLGGIGISTPSGLALPAFASSCHSVEPEVLDVLPSRTERVHLCLGPMLNSPPSTRAFLQRKIVTDRLRGRRSPLRQPLPIYGSD